MKNNTKYFIAKYPKNNLWVLIRKNKKTVSFIYSFSEDEILIPFTTPINGKLTTYIQNGIEILKEYDTFQQVLLDYPALMLK